MDTYLEEIRQENNKNAPVLFFAAKQDQTEDMFSIVYWLNAIYVMVFFPSMIINGKCWLVLSTCMCFQVTGFLNLIILKKIREDHFNN